MTDAELGKLSILALAHVGDAVYELLVRTLLAERGVATALQLHRETVARVKAPAQARAAAASCRSLTEAEHRRVPPRPQQPREHRAPRRDAGAVPRGDRLEAVFGWLWLRGERERVRGCSDTSRRTTMPLDAVCLTALVDELAPQLEGAHIDKVQQPARDLLLLSLYTRQGSKSYSSRRAWVWRACT